MLSQMQTCHFEPRNYVYSTFSTSMYYQLRESKPDVKTTFFYSFGPQLCSIRSAAAIYYYDVIFKH